MVCMCAWPSWHFFTMHDSDSNKNAQVDVTALRGKKFQSKTSGRNESEVNSHTLLNNLPPHSSTYATQQPRQTDKQQPASQYLSITHRQKVEEQTACVCEKTQQPVCSEFRISNLFGVYGVRAPENSLLSNEGI
mmetsp:Transcript_25514/g.101681  ORF Transcript_25514/g.101681 Transcript_25514/m.101681 type:complete len:134 (+) Transcript_25514:1300-1701(+)